MPRSPARCPRKRNGSPPGGAPSPRHQVAPTPEPPPPWPLEPPTSPPSSTYGDCTASSTASPPRGGSPTSAQRMTRFNRTATARRATQPLPARFTERQPCSPSDDTSQAQHQPSTTKHQVIRMRTLNVAIDLEAAPDRVWGILTATHAYDEPYQARCSSVDEDASFAGGSRPARKARCPLDLITGASQ